MLSFNELLDLCLTYDVTLVEDCCEAHGATFEKTKVGNFGVGSTFSFFYGHHMTTIEGGMVCTDNEDLWHELLLLRSHGLLRELPAASRNSHRVKGVSPDFCFLRDGYNLRNTEINAKLGVLQLEHLDGAIQHRNKIFRQFLKSLDPKLYKTDFDIEGCSNFALPIFVKHSSLLDKVKKLLRDLDIEYRPCIAGNLNRHPLTRNLPKMYKDTEAQRVHENCVYIGNHKDVTWEDVLDLTANLNALLV